MIAAIHQPGNKTRMNMLMNRILPLILLLVISRSAAAEDLFWVLGSFLNEDVARVEGNRISNDAGIEVLLFESIVNTRVQYRLLTGVLVAPSDQAALRQQLMKVGVSDPWTLRFDDGPPYIQARHLLRESWPRNGVWRTSNSMRSPMKYRGLIGWLGGGRARWH